MVATQFLGDLVPLGQFPSGAAYTGQWSQTDGGTTSLATSWPSSVKAADGSGGAITFPAFGAYTPVAYTPPSTAAPAGNAAYAGGRLTRWNAAFPVIAVNIVAGIPYTLAYYYAGDPAQGGLSWYQSLGITAPDGNIYGDGANNVQPHLQAWTPDTSWHSRSVTFTSAVTGTIQLYIFGGGTNGTVNVNSVTISGATVEAPMLIANASLTFPTQGARLFPAPLRFGNQPGTVAQGNDPRIPLQDQYGMWHPRTFRETLTVPGSLSVGTSLIGVPFHAQAKIGRIDASVGSLTTNSGDHVTFDILLGASSILGASTISITGASLVALGNTVFYNPPIQNTGVDNNLTLSLTSIQGTASNLSVTIYFTEP